uniref:Uncharacterized protein n=1 Tax=Arundo donax TaxID=35708 RepID=A0A0A9BNX1_ARUDO
MSPTKPPCFLHLLGDHG